jgi:hypothetical protein
MDKPLHVLTLFPIFYLAVKHREAMETLLPEHRQTQNKQKKKREQQPHL